MDAAIFQLGDRVHVKRYVHGVGNGTITHIGKVYRGGAFDYYIYDVEYDEPVDGPWPHYTKQHRGSFSEDALEQL